jgi:hypothetical protein
MSKDEFCYCGRQGVIAHNLCRQCYDAWYRQKKTVEQQILQLGAIKPEKVNASVSRFVSSLPIGDAQKKALGACLTPGVKANSERYWGVGG